MSRAAGALVAVGDSLSDVQGADALVASLLNTDQIQIGQYPAPPYFEGRWSNGPVWLEARPPL